MRHRNVLRTQLYRAFTLYTLILFTPTASASQLPQQNKDGFTVRDSTFKETKSREEFYEANEGKTFGDIYGYYEAQLRNGNLNEGEQSEGGPSPSDDNTKEGDLDKSQSGGDETNKKVLDNLTDDKSAIEKGKVYKCTEKDIKDIIEYACSKENNNYLYGGENPDVPHPSYTDGADCSGFMWAVFHHFGFNITRTTASGMANSWGVEVPISEMKPGDILFFAPGQEPVQSVCHTGLYIGNKQMIDAEGTETQIGQIKYADIVDNPKGGLMANYQALIKVKRVVSTGAPSKSPTDSSSSNSGSSSYNPQIKEVKGSKDSMANIDEIKKRGKKGEVVVTQLSDFEDGVGVVYSVGSKYTIALDPGHQRNPDNVHVFTGCVSDKTGTPEYTLVMKHADIARKALNKAGYNVVLTRTSDDSNAWNVTRGKIMSGTKSDMSISLHFDSFDSPTQAKGGSTIVGSASRASEAWNQKGLEFGRSFQKRFCNAAGLNIRSEQTDNFMMHPEIHTPFFLVEMGFIDTGSGVDDCAIVETDKFREIVAKALVETCQEYFPNP